MENDGALLLSGGPASRLHRSLVADKKIATSIGSFSGGSLAYEMETAGAVILERADPWAAGGQCFRASLPEP